MAGHRSPYQHWQQVAHQEEDVDSSFPFQVMTLISLILYGISKTNVPILRILEDFLDVMNTHCHKLCDNILEPVAGCGQEFDVFPMVYLFK